VVRLLVGDFSLTKSHCYAGPEGSDAVFLAPAGIRRYALRSIFEFRDKRITDVQVARLERIAVESPTTRVDWRKTRSREWMTVENGDTILGDSTAVEAIARTLRGLRAKNMLLAPRDDASEYFTEPRGTVTMWTGDAAPVKVEFGNLKNSRCYVANSSDARVALVDTTVLRIFRQTVEDFRDKRLLRFAADRTALITVINADRTTTIAQTEGRWRYSNPEFGAIDQNRARRFVGMLRSLEFDVVIEERLSSRRAFGFDDPYLELAVFDANGTAIDRLLVGMNVNGATDRYVTSASSGSLATLSASALDALLRDFDNLGSD
jgi:hypothetical protein